MEMESTDLSLLWRLTLCNSIGYENYKVKEGTNIRHFHQTVMLRSFNDVLKSLGSFDIPEGCFCPVQVFV